MVFLSICKADYGVSLFDLPSTIMLSTFLNRIYSPDCIFINKKRTKIHNTLGAIIKGYWLILCFIEREDFKKTNFLDHGLFKLMWRLKQNV